MEDLNNEQEKSQREYFGSAFRLQPKDKATEVEFPAYSVVIDVEKASKLNEDEKGNIHLSLYERKEQKEGNPTHSVVETYLNKDGEYSDQYTCKDIVMQKSELSRLAANYEGKSAYLYLTPSGAILASAKKYENLSDEEKKVKGRCYEPGRYLKNSMLMVGSGWENKIKNDSKEVMYNITLLTAALDLVNPDKEGKLHLCVHKANNGEDLTKPNLFVYSNPKYTIDSTDLNSVRDLVIPKDILLDPNNSLTISLNKDGKETSRQQIHLSVDPQGSISFNKLKYPDMEKRVIEGARAFKIDKKENLENMHKEVAKKQERRNQGKNKGITR